MDIRTVLYINGIYIKTKGISPVITLKKTLISRARLDRGIQYQKYISYTKKDLRFKYIKHTKEPLYL